MSYPYGYGAGQAISPYQQQMYQDRLNAYEQQYRGNQYNNYMGNQQFNQPQQMIKCRPVSSYDEAKASMIDLDGSMFVFTDIANKKIYTKQIMLDGSAELKTYVLEEQPNMMKEVKQNKNDIYVLKSDFDKIVSELRKQIEGLKEVLPYDTADGKSDVKK